MFGYAEHLISKEAGVYIGIWRYPDADGFTVESSEVTFGKADTANYIIDNVECVGDESSILNCPHATTHDCARLTEMAGVICKHP